MVEQREDKIQYNTDHCTMVEQREDRIQYNTDHCTVASGGRNGGQDSVRTTV